jgi:tripeptidyl-peptidase I
MFGRWKGMKSTLHWPDLTHTEEIQTSSSRVEGGVDPNCNITITLSCLRQLYNAVGYRPLAGIGNSIGITGYLEQFANIEDLQSFYAE